MTRKRRQAAERSGLKSEGKRSGNAERNGEKVSRKKQLQRLKPAEDERKLQTKLIVKLREWRPRG